MMDAKYVCPLRSDSVMEQDDIESPDVQYVVAKYELQVTL